MRSFDVKVNKKAMRAAFRAALAAHAKAGTLALVDPSGFDEPSTKRAAALAEAWGKERPLMVVVNHEEQAVAKSFRNLDRVAVATPPEVEVAALVWAESLLVTEGALELLQRRAR
jgi:ribosomal protein L4